MQKNSLRPNKKGIHGIGILLIFMAMVLIAVTISGFLIYKSNQMAQEGQETFNQIGKNLKHFQIVDVSGYDGRDQTISYISIDAKLAGDGAPLDLRKMSLSIGDNDFKTILNYRGEESPIEQSNQGYNTWSEQEFGELTYTQNTVSTLILSVADDVLHTLSRDLDGDAIADDVEICDEDGVTASCPSAYEGTHLLFTLSNGGYAYAELRNQDLTLVNVSTGGQVLDVVKSPITDGTKTYGYISLSGTTPGIAYELDDSIAITVYGLGYLLDADLDDDGQDDYLGLNETHFTIDLSGSETDLSYPLGVDLSGGAVSLDVDQLITGTERFGTLRIQGTTTGADVIDASVTVTFTPYRIGHGYYVTEHLIRDKDSLNGFMISGDVVRFYVETYANISSDEVLDIAVLYYDLDSLSKKIYVGNTFPNTERIPLWPKP